MMMPRSGNGIRSAMQRLHYHPFRHIHTLTAAVSNLRVNRNGRYHGDDYVVSDYNISASSLFSRRSGRYASSSSSSSRSNFSTTSASLSNNYGSKDNNDNAANNKDNKIRLTTLRLYRMLQRSCRDLATTNDDGTILLQTEIKASDWGHHKLYDAIDDCTTILQSKELIQLFLVWNDNNSSNNTNTNSTSGIGKMNDWYNEIMMSNVDSSDDVNEMLLLTKRNKSGSCWTTPSHLREAVRIAFRFSSSSSSLHGELHGWAIRAIQILQDQNTIWDHSSVSVTPDETVRVTATSRFLGTSSSVPITANFSPLVPKYRFAYRIRVENVSKNSTTVQLLGRYWCIAEERNDDDHDDHDDHDDDDDDDGIVEVDAPYTGAVGQLPVLKPGQVFEYVSGTELATSAGSMLGHLYMATVPDKTRSGKSGDNIKAVSTETFQAPVKPFRFDAFERKK
ncbi:MAG: hypothetical protein ACI8RD_000383 [Bacillariaceae sp.]|jgi:uncharacterized protein affecting Mg2+/Co2+ transport